MNKIAMFLDVDGVLNQYSVHERLRRNRLVFNSAFTPYPKKIARLSKLVKKYNIDVYVFSAWSIEKLQPHIPFKLCGDTYKYAGNLMRISRSYDFSLVIDDELSSGLFGKERMTIPYWIKQYQPNHLYGLVKDDFRKLELIIKKLVS